MRLDQFAGILDAQLTRVRDILVAKRGEYAADHDVLGNFRRAAQLLDVGMPQALAGMMVKHTVSIYDMVKSGKPYSVEVWDEKITDHINYLILLRAALIDNANPDQGKLTC